MTTPGPNTPELIAPGLIVAPLTPFTADLRVEFMRSARPGTLRAEGSVVQRNRRVAFCSAELYDAEGELLASSRCTQIIRRD